MEPGLSLKLSVSGLKGINFLVASTEYEPSFKAKIFINSFYIYCFKKQRYE